MSEGGTPPERGAVFVTQMSRAGLIGPLAPWIALASWAAAGKRRYGAAWMVTPEGVLDPAVALARATDPARTASNVIAGRRRGPEVARTAMKDLRRIVANRRFRARADDGPWRGAEVAFVMQLHGLFSDGGLHLAASLGAPSVLVVDAVQVVEARAWGIRRPGWGDLAIRFGERPALRHADLVVCVSDEVADSVTRHTGRRAGVVSIPNGVDTTVFSPGPSGGLRTDLGLDDAFVVGWSGSFRRFHGLGTLVGAAARLTERIPNLALLLLGDGLQRPAVEAQARDAGVRLVLPGTVPHTRVPDFLRCMDAAVVLAEPGEVFHYSPVKLREYQACGLPVVAASVGELVRALEPGREALLVEPGDPAVLAAALQGLHDDRAAAAALGAAGRASVVATGSWASRLVEVERLLGLDPPD